MVSSLDDFVLFSPKKTQNKTKPKKGSCDCPNCFNWTGENIVVQQETANWIFSNSAVVLHAGQLKTMTRPFRFIRLVTILDVLLSYVVKYAHVVFITLVSCASTHSTLPHLTLQTSPLN